FVVQHEPGFTVDNLSGSSQVIPFGDGYLAVLHTAHAMPGEPYKRYYHHRFVQYDRDFRVEHLSLPFCFNDRTIEFCAGMCTHPSEDKLVLSYGVNDREAWLATVSVDEVESMLWASPKLPS